VRVHDARIPARVLIFYATYRHHEASICKSAAAGGSACLALPNRKVRSLDQNGPKRDRRSFGPRASRLYDVPPLFVMCVTKRNEPNVADRPGPRRAKCAKRSQLAPGVQAVACPGDQRCETKPISLSPQDGRSREAKRAKQTQFAAPDRQAGSRPGPTMRQGLVARCRSGNKPNLAGPSGPWHGESCETNPIWASRQIHLGPPGKRAKQTQFSAEVGWDGAPEGEMRKTNPIPDRRDTPLFHCSIIPPFQPDANRAKRTQFQKEGQPAWRGELRRCSSQNGRARAGGLLCLIVRRTASRRGCRRTRTACRRSRGTPTRSRTDPRPPS
jgi:hypothetical protein